MNTTAADTDTTQENIPTALQPKPTYLDAFSKMEEALRNQQTPPDVKPRPRIRPPIFRQITPAELAELRSALYQLGEKAFPGSGVAFCKEAERAVLRVCNENFYYGSVDRLEDGGLAELVQARNYVSVLRCRLQDRIAEQDALRNRYGTEGRTGAMPDLPRANSRLISAP